MVKSRPCSPGKKEPRWRVPSGRHNMAQSKLTVEYPQVLIRVIPRIMHGADVGGEPGRPGRIGAHTSRSEMVSADEQRRPSGLRMWVA